MDTGSNNGNEARRQSRLILSNGTWSAAQQGIGTIANSLVAFLLVLFVPVSDFGVYSYATALVAIGMSLVSAGLQGLAVKALIQDPDQNNSILTALLFIREMLALVSYGLIVAISLTSGEFHTVAATLVAGAVLFARAGDAPELWYRAKMRNRDIAIIRIVVTLTVFAIKLAALWLWPTIWLFLWLYVLEGLLATSWILWKFTRDAAGPGFGRPSLSRAAKLLKQSLPLALSAIASQVNLRGDTIIIQAMMTSTAVGVYSLAARVAELAYFLPVVFMNASLPVLLKIRSEHGAKDPKYTRFLQRSYDQAFWVGIVIAIVTGFVGTFAIDNFLGQEYQDSKMILWIYLAACPFVFMAAVYSKWIIAEGVLWQSLVRHSAGAVTNICLNIALIPTWGLIGAAYATLASYILASYLTCFFGKVSRPAGIQMTLAIFAPARLATKRIRKWIT